MKKGDSVHIKNICLNTSKTYGFNKQMERMQGSVQKIDSILKMKVRLESGTWTWHRDDLELVGEMKKIPKESFNPDNLVIPEVSQ